MSRLWDQAYRDTRFKELLPALSEASLRALQAMMRRGIAFNHLAVAEALAEQDLARVKDALPPIPADLERYDTSGLRYRTFMDVDPTDVEENVTVQRRYVELLQRRRDRDIDAPIRRPKRRRVRI